MSSGDALPTSRHGEELVAGLENAFLQYYVSRPILNRG
jgi:hypothetical protein